MRAETSGTGVAVMDEMLKRHGVCVAQSGSFQSSAYWPYERFLEGKLRQRLEFLETAAGLPTPASIPPSTPRVLTYRAIAQISTLTMLGDVDGIIAHEPDDGPGFAAFPLVEIHDPEARKRRDRYWILCRNGDTYLAMLDTEGYAFVGQSRVHLPTVYAQRDRNLSRMVMDVFGVIF